MKRSTTFIAAALAATLAVFPMAGCGGQEASESGSGAATETTEQTQEEIIAELKDAVADVPEFKSVAVHSETKAIITPVEEGAESETVESTSDYKFDESGDALKTSVTHKIGDVEIKYMSDGDDAVCITDGPIYSGTTEQFDELSFQGFDAYFTDEFDDFNTIIDCVDNVEKEQQGDKTTYTLALNCEKYIASDEILTILADNGDPIQEAVYTLGFDKDGRLVEISSKSVYKVSDSVTTATFSDFDSTVVDPLPEADKTYEEMDADIQKKYDDALAEIEATSAVEEGAEAEAEAK